MTRLTPNVSHAAYKVGKNLPLIFFFPLRHTLLYTPMYIHVHVLAEMYADAT